jgi:DNA-binding NarL/FixJ family response regulator
LLALGFTHGEVADRLSLSIKTVETYLARLSQKLGLKRRADLVRFAFTTGIVGDAMHRTP